MAEVRVTPAARKWIALGAVSVLALGGYVLWTRLGTESLPAGFASGNGRIEAVEVDIAALAAGRVAAIPVAEGQLVQPGEVLVVMDTRTLEAEKRQAEAQLERARIGVQTAGAVVAQREAEQRAAEAAVAQAEAGVTVTGRRLARSEQLFRGSNLSEQALDTDRGSAQEAAAAHAAAEANLAATEAGIGAARAAVVDARAAVSAAEAAIDQIVSLIDDSTLTSPRLGRVQYKVAQEGEVLGAGGRVLNLVDLSDVYMTFFLPTEQAGRVAIGSEVRLVLDAAPQHVIPASVSYVSDVAQFTPRTVETAEERAKLMFRVRAKIPSELLLKYVDVVKTGLPGMAYVRLDPAAEWPENLRNVVQ